MKVVRVRLEAREVLAEVEMVDRMTKGLHKDGYEIHFMGGEDTLVLYIPHCVLPGAMSLYVRIVSLRNKFPRLTTRLRGIPQRRFDGNSLSNLELVADSFGGSFPLKPRGTLILLAHIGIPI